MPKYTARECSKIGIDCSFVIHSALLITAQYAYSLQSVRVAFVSSQIMWPMSPWQPSNRRLSVANALPWLKAT